MKQISGKEFAKVLERQGWQLLRIKGSHHIYGKKGFKVRISIPIHGDKPLKPGLLGHFLSLAQIDEKDL